MYTLSRYPKGPMDRAELRKTIKAWPYIMRQVTDPWALRFISTIWEKSADPFWLPTLKQSQYVRLFLRENNYERGTIDLIK